MRIFFLLLAGLSLSYGATIEEQVKEVLVAASSQLEQEAKTQQISSGSKQIESQRANEFSVEAQSKGEILQRATQLLVAKYGSQILVSASSLDIDTLIGQLFPQRTKRYANDVADDSCFPNGRCDPREPARSISGRCNNLDKPNEGSAMAPLRRLLNSAYDDGVGSIRNKSVSGGFLPSTRLISNKIFAQVDDSAVEQKYNHLLMQMGQIIAHDIIFTPSSTAKNGSGLDCSNCNGNTVDKNCAPIPVPSNDSYFVNRACLRFTRALNAQKGLGERLPINQNTHFLDLSLVYGSDECTSRQLQAPGGLMKDFAVDGNRILPQDKTDTDCQSSPSFYCFLAGDSRNSLHPGLIPIHVFFLQMHNKLARQIITLRPKWDGNRVYQETRRILIASYQRLVYEKYLPIVIGSEMMTKFDLNVLSTGTYNKYSSSVSPAVTTEFGSAAFRFGHSSARRSFPRVSITNTTVGSEVFIGENIFYADSLYDKKANYHESIANGHLRTPMMKVDNQFVCDMRNQMFEKRGSPGSGVDLPAVNVQRGRDLGVRGYNAYRTLVGLKKATSFDTLSDNIPAAKISLLKSTYSHVDDIDLYVGIMLENPLPGALVGRTAAYIIGEQFSALKKGDRFFYENNVPGSRGLTPEELTEIRSFDFRYLFCANSATTTSVPKNIFEFNSPLEACSTLKPLRLETFLPFFD